MRPVVCLDPLVRDLLKTICLGIVFVMHVVQRVFICSSDIAVCSRESDDSKSVSRSLECTVLERTRVIVLETSISVMMIWSI